MPSPIAEHLAERFASDARALRARAESLTTAARTPSGAPGRGGAPRPGARPVGPGVDATQRMADACDRVRTLFVEVPDDEAARALLPTLSGLVAGARSEEERHVYAGAVSRLSDALAGGTDDQDDDDPDDADPDQDDEEDER
jgi:hypothetical protein